LGDVAPAKASKHTFAETDDVWTLNLDQVEADTGKVLQKIIAPVSAAGPSTHGFDERHVLYSKLRPYLNKVVLPDDKGLATTELVPMLPDAGRLDRKYLAYYLRSKSFVDWVSSQVAGAKMPRVSMQLFWQHEIPLPSLSEQKRIAAILDKADAIRRKRQQAIQLADDFLRAVFLDMFGDPVTNPKGWSIRRFGDIGTWSSGGTPPRSVSDFFEGNINWYSAGELNSRYLGGSLEKISESAIKSSAAKIFKKGTMLVGMYDTAALKISILMEDSSSNQACANVECNELANVEWLYSYIDCSKDNYLSRRRGVRQKNLNLGMIRDFCLPLPPRDLQDDFVKFVSAVFDMKKLQEEGSEFPVFESLSQKAFSGRL
jgi:type I restriction enzyme S subunit